MGIFLCSEALRPGVARRLTQKGATILANRSNDSWLGTEAMARLQLRSTALRAIENRRPILRATGSGKSAIIRSDGRVEMKSHFGRADVLYGVVEPRSRLTLYGRSGDVAVLLAAAIARATTGAGLLSPGPPTTVEGHGRRLEANPPGVSRFSWTSQAHVLQATSSRGRAEDPTCAEGLG